MNGLKKTLSIMLCVAMIASGSFMAFAEGESNPQNVTVVEGENGGENVGGEEDKEAEDGNTETGTGTEEENKEQSEALLAAAGALNNLPLFDSLTEDTDADALLAQVQAARKAYDALTEEEKLLVEEGKLNNLLDLEFFFENRPSNTPVDAPVSEVVEALDAVEAAVEDGVFEVNGQKYATLAEAIENVQSGDTIYVLRDVSDAQGISVPSNSNFTIDFQNHTYTLKDPGAGSAGTETNGFQLLRDSTITFKNGTIKIAPGNKNIKRIIQNYADLTLENMQIYAANQVGGENYPLSFNNGNITFKGNTSIITSSDSNAAFDVFYWKNNGYTGTTVTFDESYTGTINGKIVCDNSESGNSESDKCTLIIKGNGTFGKIEGTNGQSNPSISISGGTFTESVKEYLADDANLNFELQSNGIYSYYATKEEAQAAAKDDPNAIVTNVETGEEEALYPAAKIGDKTYNTLEEALKAAQSGDTIVLQKDVSTGAVTLPAGVTLDGGNHVITCNTEIANGAFITATGDNVTIKNATVNVDGKAKHGIQFYKVKGGKLENVNVMGGKYTAVIVNGAEVSINGGNLSTNGYAVVEYAMGKNVTEVPKLTMNNVTTPNTKEPLVYMDKDTIGRIKENTDLGDNANSQQVLEYLKKDNLTGNNIENMKVDGDMIIVPAPSTPVAPPVVPEKPNSNSGSTGSSSTVQQMEEREKPDPADKKAMEEYNFWMQVKSKIRATEEGKTLRITVKKGIEYMPASVMQTLYECKVGITLYWDGVTIEIPVGKAQPKQALRVYWTKTKLMDLYNA